MPVDDQVEYRDSFGDLIQIERSGATIRVIVSTTVDCVATWCGAPVDAVVSVELDITTARAVSDAIAMMARNAEADHA